MLGGCERETELPKARVQGAGERVSLFQRGAQGCADAVG